MRCELGRSSERANGSVGIRGLSSQVTELAVDQEVIPRHLEQVLEDLDALLGFAQDRLQRGEGQAAHQRIFDGLQEPVDRLEVTGGFVGLTGRQGLPKLLHPCVELGGHGRTR